MLSHIVTHVQACAQPPRSSRRRGRVPLLSAQGQMRGKCAGTRWFEVDRGDVLAAKQALLVAVGALPAPPQGTGPPAWMVARLRRRLRHKKLAPPSLKAASWNPIVADLNMVLPCPQAPPSRTQDSLIVYQFSCTSILPC
jgi:hypothetical protein